MISVLTYDMLKVADINAILSLYKGGYVHIEPKIKKVSIIDLGMVRKDIIAFSYFNFSINIFSMKFNLDQLLSLKSDAYILWGSNKEIENIDCLLEKIKKLVGEKTLIGIGTGKQILEAALKDLDEDDWKDDNEIRKHCKYKIYCLEDNNLEKMNEVISLLSC